MSVNDQTSLENLESCRDAVDAVLDVIKENKIRTEFNDNQDVKLGAAIDAWQKRKEIFENDQLADWTNKLGDYAIYKDMTRNETFTHPDSDWTTNCGVICGYYEANREWNTNNCKTEAKKRGFPHFDDYYYNGGWRHSKENIWDGAAGNKKAFYDCSRLQNKIDFAIQEYNSKKPQFTEPMPTKYNEEYVHQNLLPNDINIQCCANIIRSTGDIYNTAQSCRQSIDQSIKDINASGYKQGLTTPLTSSDLIPDVKDNSSSNLSSNSNIKDIFKLPTSLDDITNLQYGIFVFILFICLSSMSISSFLAFDE